jgi:hypothetical protein
VLRSISPDRTKNPPRPRFTPPGGGPSVLVAVKRPRPALFSNKTQHDLWDRETELMRRLQHE